jgi:hypothetical protein
MGPRKLSINIPRKLILLKNVMLPIQKRISPPILLQRLTKAGKKVEESSQVARVISLSATFAQNMPLRGSLFFFKCNTNGAVAQSV